MSGSSKRKARREMARTRAAMTAAAPAAFDKAALTKLADHLEDVLKEVMPPESNNNTSISTETQPPPESPEEAGADTHIELPAARDIPLLVNRVNREHEQRPSGRTYEEDNWDKLSPKFRDAHNRLLQARGLPTIPPPKVDNYKPPPPAVRKTLVMDTEALAAARQFLRLPSGVPMLPGEEGFTIDGVKKRL